MDFFCRMLVRTDSACARGGGLCPRGGPCPGGCLCPGGGPCPGGCLCPGRGSPPARRVLSALSQELHPVGASGLPPPPPFLCCRQTATASLPNCRHHRRRTNCSGRFLQPCPADILLFVPAGLLNRPPRWPSKFLIFDRDTRSNIRGSG